MSAQRAQRPPSWRWGRWAWRTLTSMRTAVILLCCLALAAIPGSLLPQRNVASDPSAVSALPRRPRPLRRGWTGSGCSRSTPRPGSPPSTAAAGLDDGLRPAPVAPPVAQRPRPPPCGAHTTGPAGGAPHATRSDAVQVAVATAASTAALRAPTASGSRRRRRGPRREGLPARVGNLVFHLSLLVLLVGVGRPAVRLRGPGRGRRGRRFTNARSQYDAFTPSAWTDVREPARRSRSRLDDFDGHLRDERPQPRRSRSYFDATVSVDARHRRRRRDRGGPSEPPARRQRDQDVPHRPRLRPGSRSATATGAVVDLRAGDLPARRTPLRLRRRDQGAGRPAGRAGLRGLLPAHRRRSGRRARTPRSPTPSNPSCS